MVAPPIVLQRNSLHVGESLQLTEAALPGGTIWSVNGIPGGNQALGTITPSGMYTAPAIAPLVPVTLTAGSQMYPNLTASVNVFVLNPEPKVNSVSPTIASASSPVTVVIQGDGFVQGSTVEVGGNDCVTSYVSRTELRCDLDQDTLESVSTTSLPVMVTSPHPGGGNSSAHPILIIPTGAVAPTAHPLVANYQINVPVDASVGVDFGRDLRYGRSTWTRATPPGGGLVSFLVGGMLPAQTYHLCARVTLADGTVLNDTDHLFVTGNLPPLQFPVNTVTQPPGAAMAGGVDLLSVTGSVHTVATFVVTDRDGSVLWYYDDPTAAPGFYTFKQMDNGDFLLNMAGVMREVDLAGNTVRQVTADEIGQQLAAMGYSFLPFTFHHDMLALPNGHWILLLSDERDFQNLPGYPGTLRVTGDAIVDINAQNQVSWVWRAFDHFDVNRHPFQFPDWTHSNALVYTPDGNLLLSIRHQSWIIKIDYQDGAGAGDIVWRLGPGGDFTLDNPDPTEWFYNQHFPILLGHSGSQTTLALFDNGNLRPVPVGTNYSRVVEMTFDEQARTATIPWEYHLAYASPWGGSVVPLPNGDLEFDAISAASNSSTVTEITTGQNPAVVWSMTTPSLYYRAYRIPSLYPGVWW